MKSFFTLGFLFLFSIVPAMGQSPVWINKYALAIQMDAGHSFPNFDRKQERWKATFYPAGGISILLANRLHPNWISELGVGITGYALQNKGSLDKYTLDFASPHATAGLGYYFGKKARHENFLKITGGFQLGYQGSFIDSFETYQVTINGENDLYYFVRPELGFRRYFKKRKKGARYKMAYEFGTYFRYNFNSLGTAKIEESDFELVLSPSGNMIGGYLKIYFPLGRKRVKYKSPTPPKPPVIYHPRHLK